MIEHRYFVPIGPSVPDVTGRVVYEVFVSTDGRNHEIGYGKAERPTSGYQIQPFYFHDELAARADGCEFLIEPFQSTRTQHIVEDATFMDMWEPMENAGGPTGDGTFLAVSPEGEVISIPVSSSEHMSDQIKYREGWTITWIAGRNGLRVMSISTPPFRPGMEVEVQVGATEVNGVAIPQEYWERYRDLKRTV